MPTRRRFIWTASSNDERIKQPGAKTTLGAHRGIDESKGMTSLICSDMNKSQWTTRENALLAGAVGRHGGTKVQWRDIEPQVPGRSKNQCMEQWRKRVKEMVDRKDENLLKAMKIEEEKRRKAVKEKTKRILEGLDAEEMERR
ncbi:hypothetical protein THAOC_20850, partial [Thalassiosira oceanica]